MAKKSFLDRLRERGWKESPDGWIPPAPGMQRKPQIPVRVKKTRATGEGMNSLEARYVVEILDPGVAGGNVAGWFFESFRLKLAPKTFYTPDFMVIKSDGQIVFREVKGFLREDASVKFKWAREVYPFFEFEMWGRRAGQWYEILPKSSSSQRKDQKVKKLKRASNSP
jgi:hypothetical protein